MGIVVVVAELGEDRRVENEDGNEEVVERRIVVVRLQVAVDNDIYLWFVGEGYWG